MKLLDKFREIGDQTVYSLNKPFAISLCHGYYEDNKGTVTVPENIYLIQYSIPGRVLQGLEARYILQALLYQNTPLNIPELSYQVEDGNGNIHNFNSGIKPFVYEPGDQINNLSLKFDNSNIYNCSPFLIHYNNNDKGGKGQFYSDEDIAHSSRFTIVTDYKQYLDKLSNFAREKEGIDKYYVIQLSCKETMGNDMLMPYNDVCNLVNLNLDKKYFDYETSCDYMFDFVVPEKTGIKNPGSEVVYDTVGIFSGDTNINGDMIAFNPHIPTQFPENVMLITTGGKKQKRKQKRTVKNNKKPIKNNKKTKKN